MACLTDPETEAGRQIEAKDAERLMVARQLSRQDSFPCHRLSKVGDSTHSIMSATTTLSVYVSLMNPVLSNTIDKTPQKTTESSILPDFFSSPIKIVFTFV